ncbi:MAG: SDR family oxidoreductase [Pseudomonadota bacterium]
MIDKTKKPVAVISGAASGIGLAAAEKFHAQGYQIFALDKAAINIDDMQTVQCDVSRVEEIKSAVDTIMTQTDRIDVLVSAAGIHLSRTIEDTSEEDYFRVLNTNLTGTFFLLKYILPIMKKQSSGAVVLVASEQCFVAKPHSAIYGATKSALGYLAKSTAIDYAPYHIRVNCVCPGTIDTPLYRKAIQLASDKSGIPLADIEREEAACQLVNRVGRAEEIAESIYFLASDKAEFITGTLLTIDGGYTAR